MAFMIPCFYACRWEGGNKLLALAEQMYQQTDVGVMFGMEMWLTLSLCTSRGVGAPQTKLNS
jgi:hypothetical protein